MKKLLLIPFLALAFGACSTDTDIEDIQTTHSSQREMASVLSPQNSMSTFVCLDGLEASTFISTVNGINNPTITFISNPPASATGSYKVRIEIEELTDCENLESGSGNLKIFTTGLTYGNVYNNPPQISGIKPSQTFMCYRWRMVFEVLSSYGKTVCNSVSPWYDAPLF